MCDYDDDDRVIEGDFESLDDSDFHEDLCGEPYEDTATIDLNDIIRRNCEASHCWNSPADN